MVALLLLLLWEPAITVAELKSQQNIIAVLVDDSRSMSIADAGADGKTVRETAAVQAMSDGAGGVEQAIPDAGVPAGCGTDADGEEAMSGRRMRRRRTSMRGCGSWWRRRATCRWARWCC
jgi:hypothetical protein